MVYLSREVWDWELNWVEPVQGMSYDLRPLVLGFGRPEFSPLQKHVARSWRVKFRLNSPAEIAAYETWSAALKGRLKGFWFPEPTAAGRILSSSGAGSMDIAGQGWSLIWDQEVRLHVLLTSPSGVKTAAEVTGATVISPGVERMTLSAAVTPAAGWRLQRLLYLRQAEDTEQEEWLTEGKQERVVGLWELTQEYLAAETGGEPLWFYRFWWDIPAVASPPEFFYTSFAAEITSSGDLYAPLAITHGSLTRSLRGGEESLAIQSVLTDGVPWNDVLADGGAFVLMVEVKQAPYSDPSSAVTIFTGRLTTEPTFTGRKVEMKFASWIDSMRSKLPWLSFGPGCQYNLYDTRTCGVSRAAYQVTGTLDDVAESQVTVSSAGLVAQPANWFAFGWIETGAGALQEVRSILSSTAVAAGSVTLRLNAPIRRHTIGQAAVILPGCDGTWATCQAKFSNLNYSGTDFVPRTNLTLNAIDVDGASGGKK